MSAQQGLPPTPIRAADAAWTVGLLLYAVGGLYVLGQGLVAVLAAEWPSLHASLHVQELVGGAFARTAARAADASHAVGSAWEVTLDYLVSLLNLVLAAVVLWLRPRERTARLLVVAMVGAAGVFNLTAQTVLETLPLTPVETTAQAAAHVVAGLSYALAMVLFPDGRAVPRWSLGRLALLYTPMALGVVLLAARASTVNRPVTLLVFFGVAVPVLGVAAQLYRLRGAATATEQAQARLLTWALVPALVLGAGFLLLVGPSSGSAVMAGRHLPELPATLYRVFQVVFVLIPLALFFGLVRHRLWDIERIVNRTFVYALVTLGLGGVYVAFVVAVQLTVGRVGSSPLIDSKPAVALTTLLLAGAFRPFRDRVQRFVDRRFNRAHYDALVTVEQFGSCLRDDVDLDGIARSLLGTVDDAMQPADVGLWLVPGRTGT
jgi:hypothetical protein